MINPLSKAMINQNSKDKATLERMTGIFKKYTKDSTLVGIGMGKTMRTFSTVLTDSFTYVPSSNQTTQFLVGKITADIQNLSYVDIYFDSADYYDKNGNLIKGGGGALTKEKLLLKMANRAVILVDKSKMKKTFNNILVPIEILKESYMYFMKILKEHKLKGQIRQVKDVSPFLTDNCNFIVDVEFNIEFLKLCKSITGVVEHGYFDNEIGFLIEEI